MALSRGAKRGLAGVAIGAGLIVAVVAQNWQTATVMVWLLFSEHRPALLSQARWDDPASAQRFNRRFRPGTPESELLTWLEKHEFDVDVRSRTARREINGMPCTEKIEVTWTRDAGGRLVKASATLSQIVCL